MLSSVKFIKQSLELHLFFARIMKEHSFFLEAGFTPKDANFTYQADVLRMEFDRLLADTISLSNGVVSPEVVQSGEVVTPYTLRAEMATTYYTGVQIPTGLTQAETGLMGGEPMISNPFLEQNVFILNQQAICLISALIQFKTTLLSNVLSCRMFTVNYPLLIDHILREAKFYLQMVQRLQNREEINVEKEAYEQEIFWNKIMAEHSKFIRGLLDPTEDELINIANNFGNEFDQLEKEAKRAMDKALPPEKVTRDSLEATKKIRDFKAQGTQGLLECKIRSIIIPLLGDHVLREANHYLRLLKMFQKTHSVKSAK
ncbi:DUF2935 domain-containing protein [Caldanaerobius polysaccharolyticus]|uniref:DUF2935 domain-containing protein n=1 Tax=Caldanaerobius polysaccharolyticus TaxID=44256 RepID=UPI00047A1B6A|nr:DUF2935 domain-containing protein [Caldanaerobius polysaccharolyticus]